MVATLGGVSCARLSGSSSTAANGGEEAYFVARRKGACERLGAPVDEDERDLVVRQGQAGYEVLNCGSLAKLDLQWRAGGDADKVAGEGGE
jgi:hypothetical protein